MIPSRPRLHKAVFFCLISALLAAAGCFPVKRSGTGTGPPSYIFLVTLDTTRADHINYTPGNPHTPNLASLAASGQYFENAYSLIPITLPSHASMFYSLPPHRLKLYNNGQEPQIPHPSLAQLLKGKGYATGAVISLGVLKADFGLARGFDRYIENFKPYLWHKPAHAVNKDAIRLINQGQGEKFFYWLHYSDPHEPYFPPGDGGKFRITLDDREAYLGRCTEQPALNIELQVKPGKNTLLLETELPGNFKNYPDCKVEYIKYQDFSLTPGQSGQLPIDVPPRWRAKRTASGVDYYSGEKKSRLTIYNRSTRTIPLTLRFIYSLRVDDRSRKAFYRREVDCVDRQLGRLIGHLKEKNIYDRSVFIIIGDHGEGLGEYRNHFGHIHYLNRSAVHVPLIIAGRGVPRRGKRLETVSTLNIAPTILDIVGQEKPGFMQGHSLLTPGPPPAVSLLLETYSPEAYFDAFSIIDHPFQAIFYPGRREQKLEFFNIQQDPQGAAPLDRQDIKKNKWEKNRTQSVNSLLKISRIITATKGKIGRASKRHREILKSLGYL
jgi:arylsulfatase A-like enzyme